MWPPGPQWVDKNVLSCLLKESILTNNMISSVDIGQETGMVLVVLCDVITWLSYTTFSLYFRSLSCFFNIYIYMHLHHTSTMKQRRSLLFTLETQTSHSTQSILPLPTVPAIKGAWYWPHSNGIFGRSVAPVDNIAKYRFTERGTSEWFIS